MAAGTRAPRGSGSRSPGRAAAGPPPWPPWTRPGLDRTVSGLAGLDHHLEEHYGIEVTRVTPLEPWAPEGVQRVDRRDGAPWVARVSPEERAIEAAEGDA